MTDMMIDLLVRVTGVLAVATLLAMTIRRSSASVRALAWTAGLVGALALPLIALLAPSVELGMLPARAVVTPGSGETVAGPLTIESQGAPVSPAVTGRAAQSEIATPTGTATEGATGIARGDATASATESATGTARESATGIATESATGIAIETMIVAGAVDADARAVSIVPTLVLLVWTLGTLLLLIRLITSHVRLHRLTAGAIPAGREWQSSVDAVRTELGIGRHTDVRTSRETDVPAVAGVFRPVLLLPACSDWTASARRDVTLHELAHVARWDALGQLVSQVACAIYWFIPLAWYAARQAAALREQACDNVVLNAGTRPSVYAERLLTLCRTPMIAQLEPVALAMARPARIHVRVLGILDPTARRTRLSASFTTAFIALSLATVALVAIVEPVAASEPRETIDQAPSSVPSPESGQAPPSVPAPGATPASSSIPSPTRALAGPGLPTRVEAAGERAVPAPPQQQAATLCRRGSENISINRHSEDGDEYWRLTAKGPGCDITIRVEGEPRFNDDFTDVVAIGGRGTFEIDARIDGVRRELKLRDDDGREAPYDAEAAAWFARFLIGLDRQTGFAVDVRLPTLLERGGVRAVLDETQNMSSDHVRSVYYTALAKVRQLTPPELARLLNQEAELNSSDYYAAELLKGVAKQGLGDPAVRDAVMRLISGMDSDFHKSESIKATVHAGRPTNDEVALLIRVVGTMDSDFHKAETVKLLMENSDLTSDQLGQVLSIVSGMSSDFHISEMLSSLVRRGTLDAAKRRAYLAATREIDSDFHRSEALSGLLANGAPTAEEMPLLMSAITELDSDHHKGEVLRQLLDIRTLRETDLLRVQLAAQTIDSDFNQSEVLRRIVGHAAATAAVKDAVYDAAGSLSNHYRDEVRRAVGR